MVLTNAYFMKKCPDTGKSIITNRKRPNNIWTRAVYYEGLMAIESVHENGFLGFTQRTGKQPSDGQPITYTWKPDFEDYGLGCFLLAGSEGYQLCK